MPWSAREVAARALIAVEHGAHAEEALHALSGDLAPRDRRQAWFLTLGVLRLGALVDASLVGLRQPIGELDEPVRAALRLGAFEQLYARTPVHAAVNEAVNTARGLGLGRAAGLVNAVLRRVRLPESMPRWVELSHPAWLVERWDARVGQEASARWCELNNRPPPLTVVLRDGAAMERLCHHPDVRTEPATWGGERVDRVLHLRDHRGDVRDLPGFAEGELWVMDLASVLVADLMPAEGRVLDACAAPGGKSLRLISRGAQLVAVDREPERLESLRRGLERTGLRAQLHIHDWLQGVPAALGGAFDAVLVDAPCTGLGTVRRHPDIKWQRQPEDLDRSAQRQEAILEAALEQLRPGGVAVYAVCSPEPEEGPEVVQAVCQRHSLRIERVLSTSPPGPNHDAFYAARMKKPST